MALEPNPQPWRQREISARNHLSRMQNDNVELSRFVAEHFKQHPTNPLDERPPFVNGFIGIVRSEPPTGSGVTTDFRDCRYWIDIANPREDLQTGDRYTAVPDSTPSFGAQWVIATNLGELPPPLDSSKPAGAGTHLVLPGTRVFVTRILTRNHADGPFVPQYVFNHAVDGFWGVIVCRGPNDDDDFTDNRYWVSRAVAVNDEADDRHSELKLQEIANGSANSRIVAATNLSEWQERSHKVLPKTPVRVFTIDRDAAGRPRYAILVADQKTGRSEPCPSSRSSSSSKSSSSKSKSPTSPSSKSSSKSSLSPRSDSPGSDNPGSESPGSDSPSSESVSPGGKVCVWAFYAKYDCGSKTISREATQGPICGDPADNPTGSWHYLGNCEWVYYKYGQPCTASADCSHSPPDSPALDGIDTSQCDCGSESGSPPSSTGTGPCGCPTKDIEVVTDVTCNGDGTITVTKRTITVYAP